ncbi:MAG: hypothetical protein A2754_01810 [Candidatus Magasanikbacteria bacterium RIFCSPHIGHO2_01_FULL_47_8]|uniref:DUF559 domain-containing protein n=1 Tax=Candidatus Magasanikbacteria bacterium RIFCSPHIGHO2_01_FULL_47_8 TaxID=1798673 RepID=A0A1F6MBQ3_9BACT|nr:MAG: hypothetical protein A2754_01810 [Candidatus Magasanikbacteria bacterium RIFCSPHIGHO2_01_FULL_47_8]
MKIFNDPFNKGLRKDLRANVFMPERIMWKFLRNRQLGHKFRRQHSVGDYVVDFYCGELYLVIEIDGKVHDETAIRDSVRENFLRMAGLSIKRYTAQQVNNDLDWVLGDLKEYCDGLSVATGKPHPSLGTTSP